MKTRLYTPEDYETVKPWWEDHGVGVVSEALLPKCGLVVEDDDGTMGAVAWLYMDNSVGVAWMSWLTTNPLLGPLKASRAVIQLIEGMEELCNEFNYGVLLTMTDRSGLSCLLGRHGFEENHKGMSQFFKRVNHGS